MWPLRGANGGKRYGPAPECGPSAPTHISSTSTSSTPGVQRRDMALVGRLVPMLFFHIAQAGASDFAQDRGA